MLHQKDVERLCRTQSQAAPGEAAYLKNYQNVLKTYAENLPDDQQKRYQEMANMWSDQSPPQEVQQKSVLDNGRMCSSLPFNTEWPNCMEPNISNNLPRSCGDNAA